MDAAVDRAVVVDALDCERTGQAAARQCARRIDCLGLEKRRVQHGDEGFVRGRGGLSGPFVDRRPRRGLVGDERHAAQQEDVVGRELRAGAQVDACVVRRAGRVGVVAVHVQRVLAVRRGVRAEHVDHVVVRAELAAVREDRVGVRARLAVEGQRVGDALVLADRDHRLQPVDDEGVVALCAAAAGGRQGAGHRRGAVAVGARLAAEQGLVEDDRVRLGVTEHTGQPGERTWRDRAAEHDDRAVAVGRARVSAYARRVAVDVDVPGLVDRLVRIAAISGVRVAGRHGRQDLAARIGDDVVSRVQADVAAHSLDQADRNRLR